MLEALDSEAPDPIAEGFVERRAQKKRKGKASLATVIIHTFISYATRVQIYKFNKVFVHIYMCFYFEINVRMLDF